MAKLTLNTIGSRYGSIDALNDNSDLIEAAFENTLSRDGTGPNNMLANLDMDDNSILNVDQFYASKLYLNGEVVVLSDLAILNRVSVKDFDAVGDGVADDTFAIQAAVDACFTSGKTVYVDAGTYAVTSIKIYPNTILQFDANATFKQPAPL
jgi:polygalacturonase